MSEWISVDGAENMPDGDWQVYLAEEMLGCRIHTASKSHRLVNVGSLFHFDCPKVTHYKTLPEPPK